VPYSFIKFLLFQSLRCFVLFLFRCVGISVAALKVRGQRYFSHVVYLIVLSLFTWANAFS
jgi:hypothetical protein